MSALYHVVPVGDLIAHDTEGLDCVCGPHVAEGLVVHNSLDGRELSEPDYRGSQ